MNAVHYRKVTFRKAQRLGRRLQQMTRAGERGSINWMDGIQELRRLLHNARVGREHWEPL